MKKFGQFAKIPTNREISVDIDKKICYFELDIEWLGWEGSVSLVFTESMRLVQAYTRRADGRPGACSLK